MAELYLADPIPRDDEAALRATRALDETRELANRLMEGVESVVLGQRTIVERVVIALLAGGHVLLEGAPGLGKTQIVRTLSGLVDASFARIQFTPDLMPSDILGTSMLVGRGSGNKELTYRPGPIFANMVLADEINRATPKTQSALLEAMAERTVSVEGVPKPLPSPFFVLATENPVEMEGVFPLPEAQLDRFLMKLSLEMPDLDTLTRIGARAEEPAHPSPVATTRELLDAQRVARTVVAAPHVERFAARLVVATHGKKGVRYGAGPRAVQALMSCARVGAVLADRPAVSCEDVKAIAADVLRHRIVLGFEAEALGLSADRIVGEVVDQTRVE